MSKVDFNEQVNDALNDLQRAITDIKKKYGDEVDTDFLQEKFEKIIKKINKG